MESLTLYYWPGASALAPHIALEETGWTFAAQMVDLARGAHREADYLAINPKSRVPALATPQGVLTENPAILRFLAEGLAAGSGSRIAAGMELARELEWMCWLASTVHVSYAHISRSERYADSPDGLAEVKRKGVESCRPLWEQIEARVGGREWVMGDRYSVVDPYLQVFWHWGRGQKLGYDMEKDFPKWTSHAKRLACRPAARRAYAREGIEPPA
jgi:glutathione S-transferase